jgi:hypothetical protein
MRSTSPSSAGSRKHMVLVGVTLTAIILAFLLYTLPAAGTQGTPAQGPYKVTVTKDGKVITPGGGGKGPIKRPVQVNLPTGPDIRYSPTADPPASLATGKKGQPPPVIRGLVEDTWRYKSAVACSSGIVKFGPQASLWYPSCGELYLQGAYQGWQLWLCADKYPVKECLGLVEPTGKQKQKGSGGSKNQGKGNQNQDKGNQGQGKGNQGQGTTETGSSTPATDTTGSGNTPGVDCEAGSPGCGDTTGSGTTPGSGTTDPGTEQQTPIQDPGSGSTPPANPGAEGGGPTGGPTPPPEPAR